MLQFQTSQSALSIRFARQPEDVQTLEGTVLASIGDAVVTGSKGESWPVPRDAFFCKYIPMPGVVTGEDGQYKKRLAFVQARQLERSETIVLSDGRGVLTGHIGDWCLTYGLGNQAFIRSDVFDESYVPSKSLAVCIGVEGSLLITAVAALVAAEASLREALPHTPIIFTTVDDSTAERSPLWFQVAATKPISAGRANEAHTTLTLSEIESASCNGALPGQIRRLQNLSTVSFSLDRIRELLTGFVSEANDPSEVELIAGQLLAIDELNAALQQGKDSAFIGAAPNSSASTANDTLRRVGAVADALAVESQKRWQELVLADTWSMAGVKNHRFFVRPFAMAWLLFGNSIVTLGLLAALGLAGFSELAEGCDAADWFSWTGCTSEGWKQWVGVSAFTLYIGALAVAWWRYAQAKVGRLEGKHQDYRLLAECLRAQYVLSVLGSSRCVADDFPAGKNAESSWVLIALRTLVATNTSSEVTSSARRRDPDDASTWAMKAFVGEQALYHETTLIKRREHAIGVLSSMGRWGAGLFLVCLVLLTVNVLSKVPNHDHAVFSPMGQHLLLILQVAGLAVWGSMRKVADTFALEQEVQRGMIVLEALKRVNSSDKQSIIRAAQLFARDQVDWHALHRSNPIEASTGGG
jgi:hypothetical protein